MLRGDVLDTSTEGSAVCSTQGEKVTWTQSLGITAGRATYKISQGDSTTWDKFGQGSHLGVSFDTTAADLSGYDPAVSLKRSGVTWERNRASSMKIVAVRYYSGTTLVKTDSSSRAVDLDK